MVNSEEHLNELKEAKDLLKQVVYGEERSAQDWKDWLDKAKELVDRE